MTEQTYRTPETWEECARHVEAGGVVECGRLDDSAWDAEQAGPDDYRARGAAPGEGGYLPRRLVPIAAPEPESSTVDGEGEADEFPVGCRVEHDWRGRGVVVGPVSGDVFMGGRAALPVEFGGEPAIYVNPLNLVRMGVWDLTGYGPESSATTRTADSAPREASAQSTVSEEGMVAGAKDGGAPDTATPSHAEQNRTLAAQNGQLLDEVHDLRAQLAAIPTVPDGHEIVVLPSEVVDEVKVWQAGAGLPVPYLGWDLVWLLSKACIAADDRRPKTAPETERVPWWEAVGCVVHHEGGALGRCSEVGLDQHGPWFNLESDGCAKRRRNEIAADGTVEVLKDGES